MKYESIKIDSLHFKLSVAQVTMVTILKGVDLELYLKCKVRTLTNHSLNFSLSLVSW